MVLRVLMITSEWPTKEHPEWAPFVVQQVVCLESAGIQVDVFSFRGGKNFIYYLKAWIKLRNTFKLSLYDVIHAQYGQSGLIALPSPVPLVVTFHGSDLQGIVGKNGRYTLQGKVLQVLSQFVARSAQRVIIVSNRLRQFLPANISVEVIPGGVDLELFHPIDQNDARRTLGLPLDKRLILFPARRNDPVKRFMLAKTAVGLLRKNLDVQLVVLQGVAHNEVPFYLNACDVLLLTSFHEGSPTVVKEALACNLPIVSTDVGDVRERIENIDGCVMCNDSDPETITAALEKVLEKRKRIDGKGAAKALDQHLLAQKIISVYKTVI